MPMSLKQRLVDLVKRPPRVAVLRLDGTIAARGRFAHGISMQSHAAAIERAFALARTRAVALIVNSPGGSAAQSSLVHDRIRALAAEKGLPVVAFVEDVAASGGYWLACAADEIYAQGSSIVGSIGVLYAGFGFTDALARLGVERRVHTAGENKAILDPFRPEKEEDVRRLKAMQADIHDAFIALVKARRGSRLNDVDGELFSGAFWTGEPARVRGLIDGLGDVRQVMRARYGQNVRLVEVTTRRSLFQRLGLSGSRLAAGLIEGAVAEIEERALWGRFGL
jgi:serine protease SohB